MTDKLGAIASHQALAVPVEPVSRLDPSGFDPSREEIASEAEVDATLEQTLQAATLRYFQHHKRNLPKEDRPTQKNASWSNLRQRRFEPTLTLSCVTRTGLSHLTLLSAFAKPPTLSNPVSQRWGG